MSLSLCNVNQHRLKLSRKSSFQAAQFRVENDFPFLTVATVLNSVKSRRVGVFPGQRFTCCRRAVLRKSLATQCCSARELAGWCCGGLAELGRSRRAACMTSRARPLHIRGQGGLEHRTDEPPGGSGGGWFIATMAHRDGRSAGSRFQLRDDTPQQRPEPRTQFLRGLQPLHITATNRRLADRLEVRGT